jgi:UDP-N-acetylmuramoyl-L-alanyl-D-glutamate--2,6-diaminopimelate ligase
MSRLFSTGEPIGLRDALPQATWSGAGEVRVTGCTCDSRLCRPGDVFVAIRGTHVDGHDYITEAIAGGARAIVAEHTVQATVPVGIVPDAREALAQLCQTMAGRPSSKLRVIGVTGTNGKTTTTQLIASVLEAAGCRTGLLGTLDYSDGIDSAAARLTTPPAPVIADWMRRMVDNRCTHAVLEVSSHAIAQRRIAGIELAAACLTNLRRDHLDFHPTLRDYHETKSRIFHSLGPAGIAVLNADDPVSMEYAPLVPGGVLTIGLDRESLVGLQRGANVTAQLLDRSKSEQTFLLTAGEMTAVVRTAMIGDHHIHSCLIAAAVGLAEGIDLPTIARGLENVTRVPGRLERIECGQPFGVFVDYAHTPDALATALDTVAEVTAGRLICVFGAGGNRDEAKRPLMGRAVEERAHLAIVTTDNPRHEDPRAIAAEVIGGFARPADARYMPDRAEAIQYALSLAGPDDCVLVAGRGHEPHQIVGDEQIPLDDREVARRYLYNLEPASPFGSLASVSNS